MDEQRKQFYRKLVLLDPDNIYLQVYQTIVAAIKFFYANNKLPGIENLQQIQNLKGFSRCWGYAKYLLCSELGHQQTEQILLRLERLYLELLPSYVPFIPQAQQIVNQPVVEYLHSRSIRYKRAGNPKYYAYDRVINIICNTDTVVSADNCREFKGIGQKIAFHIKTFLKGHTHIHQPVAQPMKRRRYKKVLEHLLPPFESDFKVPHVKLFIAPPKVYNFL